MKAMMSHEPGGPELLKLTEVETPEPGPGQVRIAVKAAGVNFPDGLVIRDLYQFKPPRPFAPGGEVAGTIEAVGDGVTNYSVGDRVIGNAVAGGFSTHIVVDQAAATPIPDSMPFDEAAGFLLTYGTSHYALRDRAKLAEGESLFILGAAGGVGAAAIEIGKAFGAKVVAGVSDQEKADFCKELGADEALIYPKGDLDRGAQKELSNQIKSLCGGEGANVIYDGVGGGYAEPALRAMAWEGRYLVVGFPAGIPSIPLNLTLLKSCQIVGVFWGAFTLRNPSLNATYVAELFDLYEKGKLRPRITATFPLEQAGEAVRLLEERKAKGKIVLMVD